MPQVDANVVGRAQRAGMRHMRAGPHITYHLGVGELRHLAAEDQRVTTMLDRPQRHARRRLISFLQRARPLSPLRFRILRHAHRFEHRVEGARVLVHSLHQRVLHPLRPIGDPAQLVVVLVELGLAHRQVRDHAG